MITKHGSRLKRQIRQRERNVSAQLESADLPLSIADGVGVGAFQRYARVAFVIVILLTLISTGIKPAAAQDSGEGESSYTDALREAGLLTELNLSQTFDIEIVDTIHTITVTLDWAYADDGQIMIGYTVDGLEMELPAPTAVDAPYVRPEIKLRDTAGNELIYRSGSTDIVPTDEGWMTFRNTARFSFFQFLPPGDWVTVDEDYLATVYGDDLPGALDLIASVGLILTTPSMSVYDEVPNVTAEFPFMIPLHTSTHLSPMLTETQQGIDVTLESLQISPTQTMVGICFDLPDERDWQPQLSLLIDDVVGVPMGWGMTGLPTPEDVARCFTVDFDALLSGDPSQITLTLDRLQVSWPESPEFWEEVRVNLIPLGIEIEVNPARGQVYRVVSAPDGMDEIQQSQLIWSVVEDLLPTVEGPWVFVVPLSD